MELAQQERSDFLAKHAAEFEHYYAEQYAETQRVVEESESAIVAAYSRWQETNGQHMRFRAALGLDNRDVPQTPPALRDANKAIKLARESRVAA